MLLSNCVKLGRSVGMSVRDRTTQTCHQLLTLPVETSFVDIVSVFGSAKCEVKTQQMYNVSVMFCQVNILYLYSQMNMFVWCFVR